MRGAGATSTVFWQPGVWVSEQQDQRSEGDDIFVLIHFSLMSIFNFVKETLQLAKRKREGASSPSSVTTDHQLSLIASGIS